MSISYRVGGLISGFSPSLRRRSAWRRGFMAWKETHRGIKQQRPSGSVQDATAWSGSSALLERRPVSLTHLSLGLWADLWKITPLTLLKPPWMFIYVNETHLEAK